MRALLVIFLAGCSVPAEVDDVLDGFNTRRAVALVWSGVYGLPEAEFAPPEATWCQEGEPCVVYAADHRLCLVDPRLDPAAGCVDGFFDQARAEVDCAWEGSYWRSALAHELFHAYLAATTWDHDADYYHRDRGWTYWVPEAQAALRASGIGR